LTNKATSSDLDNEFRPVQRPVPDRMIDGLTAETPLLDALERIFRQRWERVLDLMPAAAEQKGENLDRVHKLRVASRRLSAVLDVLAEGFPEAPRLTLYRLAAKIRRQCAEARDLDVRRHFLESLLTHASVEDAAVIERLCEQADTRRKWARKRLSRRLPKLESRLRNAGEELLEALDSIRGYAKAYPSFGSAGVRTLHKELVALWRRAETDLESTKALHRLRIACKHLRYAVEVFVPVLGESFRHDYYPQLEHLQDLLGDLNDAAQTSQVYRKLRKKWCRRRRQGRGPAAAFSARELRSAFEVVRLACAQQVDQAKTEFFDVWPGFAGESFRVPVTELLTQRLAVGTGDSNQPPRSTGEGGDSRVAAEFDAPAAKDGLDQTPSREPAAQSSGEVP
jgi:CHAD domain-containing protein